MGKTRFFTALAKLSIPAVLATGCQRAEQQFPPKIDTAQSHATKKETIIVVPPEVKSSWKAVKVAVTDKQAIKQTVYIVPIGGSSRIPGSNMAISVEAFLPAFIMEGATMTSSSNGLTNPGAKVRITEGTAVIFHGWLFSRFPTTHAFIHPRYGFTLMDAVPANKK